MWDWLLDALGPKLRPKYLHDLLKQLLARQSGSGDEPFPVQEKDMKRLCTASRDLLLKDPSLVEIRTSAKTVVVGDLHGQWSELRRIFERLGMPGSDDKIWLFLGDYVDRGPMGLEIVAALLVLKLLHPAQVFLLRGNHECSEITVLFGFCGECQRRSTLAVWEAVMQVFDALPLGALLNGKVFMCHGGISPQLRRPQDINAIRRPLDVSPTTEGLLCDLLWADPSASISGWCPNPRGVSYVFGLDAAQAWMREQGLSAIVRAHMVKQAGFEVLGANEVITVFSAADYRETGNTGAVLVIAASLDYEFVTFQPTAIRPAPSFEDASMDLGLGRCGGPAGGHGGEAAVGSRPSADGGVGVVLLGPAPRPSPFAAAAGVLEGTTAATAVGVMEAEQQDQEWGHEHSGTEEKDVPQALLQDVKEEHVVLEKDLKLQGLARRPSEELQELSKLGCVAAKSLAGSHSQAQAV